MPKNRYSVTSPHKIWPWIPALTVLIPHIGNADGFRLPYQSAVAAGQGCAFVAQADDASAVYYNPAGLVRVKGLRISAGTTIEGGEIEYTSLNGYQSVGDFGGDFVSPPPSNMYISANLEDLGFSMLGPLSVGLGITSPYGLISRYPESVPFSSVITGAKLPLLDIKPTFAYKLADWLSFGIGVDIYTFADFIGAGGLKQVMTIPGIGNAGIKAHGTKASFNTSVLITPWINDNGKPQLNFGFVYRSGGNFPLEGDYRVNDLHFAKLNTAIELPDIYTAAFAFWPIRNDKQEWKLEFDIDFSNWSNFHSLSLQLDSGQTITMPSHMTSVQSYNFGTEIKLLDPAIMEGWNVALRTGYSHSETPIPNFTFTPTVPDSNLNLASVGFGLDCHKGGYFLGLFECGRGNWLRPSTIGIDLAFQAIIFESRKVTSSFYSGVTGNYESAAFAGSLNINLSF